MNPPETVGDKFQRLVDILAALRGPGGCPWDREQDAKSIAGYFLEEVYEAVDALYQGEPKALAEELGDVLMEVVFLARIYEEKGDFDAAAALDGINAKLVRRHPHVFGGTPVQDAAQVLDVWNREKRKEKNRTSPFEGIPESAPALLRAFQIGQRAAQDAFDWPHGGRGPGQGPRGAGRDRGRPGPGAGAMKSRRSSATPCSRWPRSVVWPRPTPRWPCAGPTASSWPASTELKAAFAAAGRELKNASPAEMDAVWEEVKKRRS